MRCHYNFIIQLKINLIIRKILGTYKLLGDSGLNAIKHAIKSGYRLLDTAHVYKNEDLVGRAVRESIQDGTLKSRDEIYITSKLHSGYHNPKCILDAVKHQVNLLGLDYIDLYLIHAPWGHKPKNFNFDLETEAKENGDPILEDFDHAKIWEELEKAVDLGPRLHVLIIFFRCNYLTPKLSRFQI